MKMDALRSTVERLIEEAFKNGEEADNAQEVAFYRGQAQAYLKVLETIGKEK